MKLFMILLFSFYLSLAWKDKAIVYLFQAIARVSNATSNNCWICHDAGDPIGWSITNFPLISNASVSLQQVQLCIVSDSLSLWIHFLVLDNNSKPGLPWWTSG